MIKKYRTVKKSAYEALEEIDKFKEKMEKIIDDNPKFSYSIEMNKTRSGWVTILTINDEK